MLACIRRLLAREAGVSLPLALGALTLVTVLAAGVAAGAVRLSDESNRDRDHKRALAVAEAGLRAATYRLNKLGPSSGSCVTDVATAPADGECPPFTEDVGNGASYTYRVSPVLGLNDRCAGLSVERTVQDALVIDQRCVTARAQANGVARRLQARVAALAGRPLLPVPGILGLDGVTTVNSADIAGDVGSNALIKLGNSSTVTGNLAISASAPNPEIGDSSVTGPVVRRTPAEGPWVLAPVDPGTSATVNDNGRITSGLDPSSKVTYTASTRQLTMGNSSSLTLGGGTYNFCGIGFTNSGHLFVAPGAKVRIFIDSPDRPDSGCPAGTGTITASNSAEINAAGPAESLQIYVYGRTSSGSGNGLIEFKNSVKMQAVLHAPQSSVVFKNSAEFTGAINATTVAFENSVDFSYPASLASADLRARTLAVYYRTGWTECPPQPSDPADPESGC